MNEQTLSPNLISLPWFIQAAEFFLEENNLKKKWENLWSFKDIDNFLRFVILANIGTDLDLRTATFETVVAAVKDSFSQKEEIIKASIPPGLKDLVDEYQEARAGEKEKIPLIQKRASQNAKEKIGALVKAYQEATKNRNIKDGFVKEIENRLSRGPISLPISPTEVQEVPAIARVLPFVVVAKTIADELEANEDLSLQVEKIFQLPEEQKAGARKELFESWQTFWKNAVIQAAETLNLTEEQTVALEKLSPPSNEVPGLIADLKNSPKERTKINSWVESQLSPMDEKKAREIAEVLSPILLDNLPPEISPENFEEALVVSLAQAPLTEKGIPLTPTEINQIFNRLKTVDVQQITAVLEIPAEERNFTSETLLVPSPTIELTTTARVYPLSFLPITTIANLQLVDSEGKPGKTIKDTVKEILEKEGLSSANISRLRKPLDEFQSFWLTRMGVTPEDLGQTIEKLKQRGVGADSPVILELNKAKENLVNFQKTAFTPEQIRNWADKRVTAPLRLPFSSFGTFIDSAKTFRPKGLSLLLRKVFGEKIVFLNQYRAVVVDKLSFLRHKVATGVQIWFFNTGLGKSIKLGLEKAAQKSLQALWTTAKIGIKKAVTKGITAVLTKIGLQAVATVVAPVIGNIVAAVVAFVGGKLVKGIFSLLKKGSGFITSGFGLGQAFFSSFSSAGFEQKDQNQLLKYVALPLAVLVFIFITTIATLGGAFRGEGRGASNVVGGIEINPQCQNTRHLSEETICKLSHGSSPCNNSFITIGAWSQINSCFLEITLTKKDVIKDYFLNSINNKLNNGNLQCGSFVMAIQAAKNIPLIPVDSARDWLLPINVSSYYNLTVSGKPELKSGDILLWQGSFDGHAAIFIENDGKEKVVVAEANGFTGKIALVSYPYTALGTQDGSPDGILKPK